MNSVQPEDTACSDADKELGSMQAPVKSAKRVRAASAVKATKYYPLNLAELALNLQTTEPATGTTIRKPLKKNSSEKVLKTQYGRKNMLDSHYQTATTISQGSQGEEGQLGLTSSIRRQMIQRLKEQGIADARVLDAMAAIPRHQFVDSALAAQAYQEIALSIGHNQTISRPFVVARMLERLMANRWLKQKPLKMLEIGTGCGYQAAVLSKLAQEVYSVERIGLLFERAKRNLRPLRIPNIRLHHGDGCLGLVQAAPFDAIIVAAAGLEIPSILLEQLKIGGRCIAPVGHKMQSLVLIERISATQWRESSMDSVFFVPLKSGVI